MPEDDDDDEKSGDDEVGTGTTAGACLRLRP